MFALTPEQVATLDSLKGMRRERRPEDPAKQARRAARNALWNSSIKDGLRRSRRVKIFCT